MNLATVAVTLLLGAIIGAAAAYIFKSWREKVVEDIARELLKASDEQKKVEVEAIINTLRLNFSSLSMEALSRSTDEFLKLAKSKLDQERESTVRELDSKKALIDQQLKDMNTGLESVSRMVADLEKDRVEKFQELATQLKITGEQTAALTQTAGTLREALASSKVRGQWGERMADDVLRLCGFVENVNYLKQKSLEGGSRPDFTFLLPRGLSLNMDVKFPLDNYLRLLEAPTEAERSRCRDLFLRNVRDKIKEVSSRDYIDPKGRLWIMFCCSSPTRAFMHLSTNRIRQFWKMP